MGSFDCLILYCGYEKIGYSTQLNIKYWLIMCIGEALPKFKQINGIESINRLIAWFCTVEIEFFSFNMCALVYCPLLNQWTSKPHSTDCHQLCSFNLYKQFTHSSNSERMDTQNIRQYNMNTLYLPVQLLTHLFFLN